MERQVVGAQLEAIWPAKTQPPLPKKAPVALRPPPRSVLAVVDDLTVRDLLLELAIDGGYGVYCANGTLEALAVLGRERPGAVLVDLDMDNEKGLRFLHIFRQLRHHHRVICVAVTSRARVELPPEVRVIKKAEMAQLGEVFTDHFETEEREEGHPEPAPGAVRESNRAPHPADWG